LPFLIRAPRSTIGVALLTELLLLFCFAFDDRFVIADVKNKISSPRWKYWEARKTRGIWW